MPPAERRHHRTDPAPDEDDVTRTWCIALALLAAPVGATAQQAEQVTGGSSLAGIFEAANVAGSRGDHAGAISNYGRLTEAGIHDPDVYFNLATSLAQSGDYARAILNYERALTLRPNDAKASENLRDAEKALEEQRAEKEGEATIQRSSSNRSAYFLNRWTGEGSTDSFHRVNTGANSNGLFSDFYVEDASYLRIQNIQLGYTFNTDNSKGIDKFRLYTSVNNAYTFTKYTGYDPSASTGEPIGGGIDQGFYPVPRTYMLGVNLKF